MAGRSERGDEATAAGIRGLPRDHRREPADETAEAKERLWILVVSPTIWAAHFLACYLTGAIWCAKVADAGGSLGVVRWAVAAYTAAALAGIAFTGRAGYRRQRATGGADAEAEPGRSPRGRRSGGGEPHALDTPADRHRFLGFATVLLSALSAVAVVYAALVAAFIGTCR